MAEWLNRKLFKGWFWRKLGSNLREWLKDAPVVVKAVLGITIVLWGWLYLVGYFPKPNPVVRGTGVFLQLLGFILAAHGLERTLEELEEFEQTPSTSRILTWICEFPDIFDTTIRGSIHVEDRPETFNAYASTAKKGLRYPETLPERVRKLEQSIADLKDDVRTNRRHFDGEVERLETKIGEEIETIEGDVEQMREKFVVADVGEEARWIEWGAIFSFTYGVPLASFPSSFLPAYRVLIVLLVAVTLLGSLRWYAD